MAELNLGVFSDRSHAEMAINELEAAGYNPKEMSLIMKDTGEAREMAEDTGTNAAEGAVEGATRGGLIGGLAGLLIGVGAIAIPGIGGLLDGGPIAAALGLTGAAATTVSGAVTGALAGGLVGALTHLGLSEDEAKLYEERVREGGILLAVPTRVEGASEESRSILEKHGADMVRSVNVG